MERPAVISGFGQWFQRSASVKAFVLGFLFLVLLIPMNMVLGLVREREGLQSKVTAEVTSKWGGQQQLVGPVLAVPYLDRSSKNPAKKTFYLLPETLNVVGEIGTQTRRRSIYNVTLYESEVSMGGVFSLQPLAASGIPEKDWLLKESRLILGISDLQGVRGSMQVRWDATDLEARIGIPIEGFQSPVVEAKLPPLRTDKVWNFSVDFRVRGNRGFAVSPAGKRTMLSLASDWPHPSFDGTFLPDKREIRPGGFTSEWNISHLNRQLPEGWTGEEGEAMFGQLKYTTLGVVLADPVSHYSKTERSTKYAGLFVVLTFAVFFLSEILAGRLFHPIQYLMVGFGLSLFYLLLLSLSEFLPFSASYAAAAGMITLLMAVYTRGVFGDARFAAQIGLFFGGLYAFLYSLLQLEDHALLVGSLMLFGALSWVMLASRKVDWYRLASRPIPGRA